MPARSTTLELRDEYRQNSKYIRYRSKDYWIRNYFLALYIAFVGDGTTTTITSRRTIVTAVNDDNSGIYSNSDNGFKLSSSYDGTRSKLETEVDRMVAD
jgi:hypothetical protein